MPGRTRSIELNLEGAVADRLEELCQEGGQPPERVVGWLVLRATPEDLPQAWLASTPQERDLLELLQEQTPARRAEPPSRTSPRPERRRRRATERATAPAGQPSAPGQAPRALSPEQRRQALEWLAAGVGVREVARRLGRAPSTISRLHGRG